MAADGDYVVAWHDDPAFGPRFRRYTGGGSPEGAEDSANTLVTPDSRPDVATEANGDYVVAWSDVGLTIRARRFEADGSRIGSEMLAGDVPGSLLTQPAVAMDASGRFTVVWTSNNQDGSGTGVYAQRYRSTGIKAGKIKRVNTTTAGNQDEPAIAMDTDGDFIVAWTSAGQDGSGAGVYAQRFTARGAKNGGEFRVNTFVTGNQFQPAVALDADGDGVITWTSEAQDGSSFGVYLQRYSSTGSVGSETRVNTFVTGNQSQSDVAMDSSGHHIVTWSSEAQDGSGYGIYAQRYGTDYTPDGVETPVNITTGGDQLRSSVSMDVDGDAVVAWDGPGTSGTDVFARRLRGPEPVDLQLTQADSKDPVDPGGRIVYRLSVANNHNPIVFTGHPVLDGAIGTASGVRVVSTVPDGATFDSYGGRDWKCRSTASKVTCKLGSSLRPTPDAPDLILRYTAPAVGGPVLHKARVDGSQVDPATANNKETEQTDVG